MPPSTHVRHERKRTPSIPLPPSLEQYGHLMAHLVLVTAGRQAFDERSILVGGALPTLGLGERSQ